jgi:8-oxo-dGTP pyrophosphatase MutT (NUDIX family)
VRPPGPLRLSVKAFLLDDSDRLLLLDCADPDRPGVCWWELPGGGVEPGEGEVDALVREVLEETGLAVDPAAVGPLQWTQDSTFLFRSVRRWSRCHGRVVRLREPGEAVATVLTDDEQGSIRGSRWWSAQELAATTDRFFPRRVPALLPRVLAGDRVDEPFDVWD